jgi:AbrB family looped-hinge helix DNA binding protein
LEISVSRVTSKGQVTIPKEIREALNLSEGDRIVYQTDGDRVYIRKAGGERLSDILLMAKPLGEPSLDFQRRLRREWDRK